MFQTVIDERGRWLSAGAARSYLRMRAAGMPAGGIASAGRTYAEQLALWEAYRAGAGNLAARPGTSRHETGRALDLTRGTPAQLWATAGAKPLDVSLIETTRAEAFGWVRDVPSEAWHFVYFPKLDTLRLGLPKLREGDKGPAVLILQTALAVKADGKLGPITAGALRDWQAAHGLAADGICGPLTWATLVPDLTEAYKA
jgi:hypothetical protein